MLGVARGRASTNGSTRRSDPSTFRIAFICTANRFRSPLGEALLRHAAAGVPLETASAGVSARFGMPVLPQALVEARRHGVDLAAHRSRPLAALELGSSDLVIGFERSHLAAAVNEAGAWPERTFTLPTLVELLPDGSAWPIADAVERARHAVAVASARAASMHLSGGPEIEDPIGKEEDVPRQIGAAIARLCTRLAVSLFNVEPRDPDASTRAETFDWDSAKSSK